MVKKARGQGKKNKPTPKQVKTGGTLRKPRKTVPFEMEHPTTIHARHELSLLGEDPDVIDWYCSVIAQWAEFGHSGASAEVTSDVLYRLMRGENLAPLTDSPDEWTDRSEVAGYPLWQSNRNPQMFSKDSGKTWFHFSELEEAKNTEEKEETNDEV
jgi:hypothetical protein